MKPQNIVKDEISSKENATMQIQKKKIRNKICLWKEKLNVVEKMWWKWACVENVMAFVDSNS